MPKGSAVWGIDLGRCALKALKLILDADGNVHLAGQDYIEHAKILSQPEANPPELIAKSLEKFLSRNDITEDQVVISVPGHHTLARFSKLPPVDPKKIPDIVQFEANQQIPFDIDEVIWDYQTFSEEASPEIEVGIFAMKRDLIHEHLANFSDAGIEPILVQSAPLGLYDAMAFDGQCGDETTVLLDIGAENTDLVITDKVRIWTRTIPIGGNNFTEALASGFKLSFSKAENLKRQAATNKYARQIFQAMRPVFAELVGEIQRSVGFYTSTHRDADLNKMVGMGNAFKLPGLQKYLQQNLGMTVIRPSKFKNLKAAEKFSQEFSEQILSFGVAYGLALEGLDKGLMKNNLLPPEIARHVIWRKKKPWFAAAAACLMVCSALVWWRQSADMRVLEVNRGAPVARMNYNQAKSLFTPGVRRDLPPREYAQTTLEMVKAIKGRYDKLTGMGKGQQDDCEQVLGLLEYKDLLSRIQQTVHDALPLPQTQLASATSGAEYVGALLRDPEALARSNRTEIFIEELSSWFVDNVYAKDYREGENLEEDQELFEYYDEEGYEGFRITLRCRTPHAQRGQFIEEKFLPALRQNGQQKEAGFYFDGIRLISGSSRSSGQPRWGSSRPMPGRRGGGRGGAMTPPGSSTVGRGSASIGGLDPLTLEDTFEDWRFVVKFVAVLDDLPEEKTPGTPKAAGKVSKGRKGRGGRGRR